MRTQAGGEPEPPKTPKQTTGHVTEGASPRCTDPSCPRAGRGGASASPDHAPHKGKPPRTHAHLTSHAPGSSRSASTLTRPAFPRGMAGGGAKATYREKLKRKRTAVPARRDECTTRHSASRLNRLGGLWVASRAYREYSLRGCSQLPGFARPHMFSKVDQTRTRRPSVPASERHSNVSVRRKHAWI